MNAETTENTKALKRKQTGFEPRDLYWENPAFYNEITRLHVES